MDPNFLVSLRSDYMEVERLLAMEDPPEMPFVSKYSAREKMEEILESLSRHRVSH